MIRRFLYVSLVLTLVVGSFISTGCAMHAEAKMEHKCAECDKGGKMCADCEKAGMAASEKCSACGMEGKCPECKDGKICAECEKATAKAGEPVAEAAAPKSM